MRKNQPWLEINPKSLKMRIMKSEIFFLVLTLFLSSCGREPEEESIDLDQMVMVEEEFDTSSLSGDPIVSPQEILIQESIPSE
ncbi:MAG: hypothetical protein KR126chlam1_01227 [Chlamydiae bacterium]|nr:hypothetical protein [Chlamydiota bacterium]